MSNDKKIEEMSQFFKVRASGYDNHMKNNVDQYDEFYQNISKPIKETNEEIEILDLGCGTGIELEGVLSKVPHALITGIDITQEMLERLRDKYKDVSNINLIQDSYMTYSFENNKYHYVISVMTMHHLTEKDKIKIYQKIKDSLKNDGKYIEGDYVVSEENERKLLKEYHEKMKTLDKKSLYHIDIPMSIKHQIELFKQVGFSNIEMIEQGEANIIFVVS